jgi:hypothetical protein
MKETTSDSPSDSELHEQTLPGLGPRLGLERLEKTKPHGNGVIRLTPDEQAVLNLLRAQADRYDWFAERVEVGQSVERLAAVLLRPPSGPGLWEEALVALSLSHEETAYALLEQWQPPAENPEMCLFHQICVSRARCCASYSA